MNDDPTQELPKSGSFEARVLSELSAIRAEQTATRKDIAALDSRVASLDSHVASLDSRLTSLEERVDARLRETRPIWEAVLEDIKRLDTKFDEVIRDIYDVRTDIRLHDKRLLQLEQTR